MRAYPGDLCGHVLGTPSQSEAAWPYRRRRAQGRLYASIFAMGLVCIVSTVAVGFGPYYWRTEPRSRQLGILDQDELIAARDWPDPHLGAASAIQRKFLGHAQTLLDWSFTYGNGVGLLGWYCVVWPLD